MTGDTSEEGSKIYRLGFKAELPRDHDAASDEHMSRLIRAWCNIMRKWYILQGTIIVRFQNKTMNRFNGTTRRCMRNWQGKIWKLGWIDVGLLMSSTNNRSKDLCFKNGIIA
jgi:hypothetical protein